MGLSRDCIWLSAGYCVAIRGAVRDTTRFLNQLLPVMLLDIHTHHTTAGPEEYILNIEPEAFLPPEHHTCYYSVGIHPWKVMAAGTGEEAWSRLSEAVRHPSVLAIGEAGLDKLAEADMDRQREVFVRQIMLSESVGKPLVVHCVKAFNELIELKKKHRPRMPWVVHGFRNNLHIARRLLDAGICFSLGEKYQADVLRFVPTDRLLAETDESALPVRAIIARMAAERGIEPDELCARIDENARKIFFRR